MILNCRDRSNRVLSMMKTRQANNVTDRTNLIYAENKTNLPCPIKSSVMCDENHIGQRRDQSYKSSLHRNQNKTIEAYQTKCSL